MSPEDYRPTFNSKREERMQQRAEEMENTAPRQEGKGKAEKQARQRWERSLGGAGSEVRTRLVSRRMHRRSGSPVRGPN